MDSDVRLSKAMSFFLRHGPKKGGPQLMPDGYLFVDELLSQPSLQKYTEDDVRRVVENSEKQRFNLESDVDTGRLKVRANQGHTAEVPELDLSEITTAENVTAVHGTYFTAWNSIRHQGLSRMKRNHIHFAPGEPDSCSVISGMRSSCELVIYVNVKEALADGLLFYRSANNVILSPGDEKGLIPPKYFEKVFQLNPRKQLM